MAPKHRRSEPPLTSAAWPEPAGPGPDWAAASEGHSWQGPIGPVSLGPQAWQDWGPPPELHPDHPSAPVPRVRFPADHPSRPMPVIHVPGTPHGYRRGAGLSDPAPATGRFQNQRSPNRDSIWTAPLADDRTAQIAREARDYAAAIREAAEREAAEITRQATSQAAEIREAAERETADLRARLDSMSGELRRMAAYVAEGLASPAMPATAPALPEAGPALPRTRSVQPDTKPARPDTKPAEPGQTEDNAGR